MLSEQTLAENTPTMENDDYTLTWGKPPSSLQQEMMSYSYYHHMAFRTPSLVERASLELEGLRCVQVTQEDASHNDEKEEEEEYEAYFPNACLALLYQIKGNDVCIDCGQVNPEWASITYGTLLCKNCAEGQCHLVDKPSNLRSIDFDTWTHAQILSMLEGGNAQLQAFFERHSLTKTTFNASPLSSAPASPLRSSPASPASSSSSSSSPASSALVSCDVQENIQENLDSKKSCKDTPPPTSENEKEGVCTLRYRTKAALFYREQLARHVSAVVQSENMYVGRNQARLGRRQQKRQKKQKNRRRVETSNDDKSKNAGDVAALAGNEHGRGGTVEKRDDSSNIPHSHHDIDLTLTW